MSDEMRSKQNTIADAIRGLNQALTLIDLAAEAVGRKSGGREISLARTNAQQARHWLIDASTEMTMEDKEDIIDPQCEIYDADYEQALAHENDLDPEEQQAECEALHPGLTHEEYALLSHKDKCSDCGAELCSCGLCHNTRKECWKFSSQCLNDDPF